MDIEECRRDSDSYIEELEDRVSRLEQENGELKWPKQKLIDERATAREEVERAVDLSDNISSLAFQMDEALSKAFWCVCTEEERR